MAVYSVSYDLNKKGQDYEGLYSLLREFTHCHLLDSTWLIRTDMTAGQLRDKLRFKLDSNDDIFITEVTKDYAAYLESKKIEWLHRHV